MRTFEIGVVLGSWRSATDGSTVPWSEIRDLALRAEAIGFDAVWSPDELLGRLIKGGPRYGFWDGIAIPAALAAATSRIKIGTWVLSSLHRNPGITAKAAATIDEISGGRSAGSRPRAAASGATPERHPDPPRGPRPQGLPARCPPRGYLELLRGGAQRCRRARTARLGIRGGLRRGRSHPSTIGRSAGVVAAPLEPAGASGMFGTMIGGSAEAIADAFRSFRQAGFTQLEFMLHPQTAATLEAMAPVLELLDRD